MSSKGLIFPKKKKKKYFLGRGCHYLDETEKNGGFSDALSSLPWETTGAVEKV